MLVINSAVKLTEMAGVGAYLGILLNHEEEERFRR